MKKWIKWSLISLFSLLGIAIISLIIGLSIALSPKTLTPIVTDILAEEVGDDVTLERIDLNLFSDFPSIQVEINELSLLDSLLVAKVAYANVNTWQYLIKEKIVVKDFYVHDADISYVMDTLEGTTIKLENVDLEVQGLVGEDDDYSVSDAELRIDENTINASGSYNMEDELAKLKVVSNNYNIEELIKLLNIDFLPISSGILSLDISSELDLKDANRSEVVIKNLDFVTGSNHFYLSGKVQKASSDLEQIVDLKLTANIELAEINDMFLDSLGMDLNGRIKGDILTNFTVSDVLESDFSKLSLESRFDYADLKVDYDSLYLTDYKGQIILNKPLRNDGQDVLEMVFSGSDLLFKQLEQLESRLSYPEFILELKLNEKDSVGVDFDAFCCFQADNIQAKTDSINLNLRKPYGGLDYNIDIINDDNLASIYAKGQADWKDYLSKSTNNANLSLEYSSEQFNARLEDSLELNTASINTNITGSYNRTDRSDSVHTYLPKLVAGISLDNAKLNFDRLTPSIEISNFNVLYTPEKLNVDRCRIQVGNSDLSLDGEIKNIDAYLNRDSVLRGNLNYYSDYTDVDQLLALVDSLIPKTEEEPSFEAVNEVNDSVEVSSADIVDENNLVANDDSEVFIVPDRVDFRLNSEIETLIYDDNIIKNVGGEIILRDKKLVANQLGFTSNAARLLCTGIYRSDRKDHLYAGFDFHLLDVDIEELINFVPVIDTLVPMLKSFKGEAEFHFAGETYLNSHYEPKISTLRAAAAIEGKNLVVLDDETFSTISKYLLFSKKAENVVDSISVEATVFRNNIDLQPFLISMDRWQAVISGRHNLNQNFQYHISVTDCPLPTRLGLDISGTFDDMKYKLAPCRYKSLYKPKRQGEVDKRVLGIKEMISSSLKENITKHYSE